MAIFPGGVVPVTYKLTHQWLPCQAPGVIGSALGLVGRCQYTVIRWERKLDLQLLSQCGSTYNCLSRPVSEMYIGMFAGTLSNNKKPTKQHTKQNKTVKNKKQKQAKNKQTKKPCPEQPARYKIGFQQITAGRMVSW